FVPGAQSIVIKTSRDEDVSRIVSDARRVVARVSPSLAVQEVTTMQRVLDIAVGPVRDVMKLLAVLTSVALLLGAIGIYGVISQFVARRARDWSIRIALGLSPGRVVTHIVSHGLALVAAGLLLGITITLVSSRLLTAFLFGVSSHDPTALAAAVA